MKKAFLLLLLSMTTLCTFAQKDHEGGEITLPDGWSRPEKRTSADADGKSHSFVRNKEITEPAWRRPQTENDTTEVVGMKGTARYCTTYADFKAGNWKVLQGVEMKVNSTSRRLWVGGNDFRFDSDDKQKASLLKKEALFVVMGDALYVNCRKLKGNKAKLARGYALGYRYDGDKVCFVNEDQGRMRMNSLVGGQFGLLGGLAAAGSMNAALKYHLCYVLNDDSKNATSLSYKEVEKLIMPHLDRKDLWDWYSALPEREKNRAENVLVVLEELDLLRAY